MSVLTFILGRSSSGKTEYIYKELKRLVSDGAKKLYMLIPEQSSFETERDLLEILGAGAARKVEVLSFSRLAHSIMRKTGKIAGKRPYGASA